MENTVYNWKLHRPLVHCMRVRRGRTQQQTRRQARRGKGKLRRLTIKPLTLGLIDKPFNHMEVPLCHNPGGNVKIIFQYYAPSTHYIVLVSFIGCLK